MNNLNIFSLLITQPLANGLVLFYKLLFQNMGLAIIGFSLFLRLILNPLTKPYMESMKRMKEFAPQLEKLKRKHHGDQQKFLKAQTDFYKEKGIKPGAGCLPYLLQIVILYAFFRVFMLALSGNGDVVGNFNTLLYPPLRFEEGQVINTRFLYLDIAQPDKFDLSGLPFALPGPILILAALVQFFSAKITTPYVEKEKKIAKKTPEAADDIQTAMQSSMIYTFPIMTLLIGLRFPSGMALYWLVFSAYQTLQQYQAYGWGGLTPWLKKARLLKYRD